MKKFYATLFITLFGILLSGSVTAEIYKWVDENGRVHYGDSPKETDNAKKVSVEVNSYKNVSYDDLEFYEGADRKRVVMYSTEWCGYCKKARRYFQKNNIRFVEYDIEKDKRAKQRYDKIGGRGVPVILVGNKRMNGFSATGFQRIYK